jgi:hypothetical protein
MPFGSSTSMVWFCSFVVVIYTFFKIRGSEEYRKKAPSACASARAIFSKIGL